MTVPTRPTTTDESARVGLVLDGRYRLKALRGGGGSAEVFEADDLRLGRAVAVKALLPELLGVADARRRLEREGLIAGGLSHPNICPVNDIGCLPDGSPYLVMDLLVGESLASLLAREGRLDVSRAVRILDQVASGVGAAHARGFLHRDLKPSNVFLVPLGSDGALVKLLDFGAAFDRSAEAEGEEPLTKIGFVVGTPMYMSPEQVQGHRDFDERTDVYGCGLLLYEMVTGVRAFDGQEGAALLESIALRGARPAHELRADLPSGLTQVITRALARDRSARFSTMHELRAALHTAARTSGPVAPPTATTAILDLARSAADPVLPSSVESDDADHDPFEPDPFADDAYAASDGATTRSSPSAGDDLPTAPRVPPPRRPPG
ncbi:MAG: serine/threonine protein kinase, partial [Labilithrix sp.]|nr:serine/threonine protein kinase [Labilithrix sp.]